MNKKLITLCFLAALAPALAIASGGPGHQTSFADTYKFWPNFFVFLVLFYFIIKSPLLNFWSSRRESLEAAVSAGKRELELAQQSLEQARLKLEELDHEVKRIQESIAEDTGREAARIVAEAEDRAARVVEQAGHSVEAERKAAEFALRQELADYVVSKAEQRLKAEMTADADRKLRQATVDQMKSLLN